MSKCLVPVNYTCIIYYTISLRSHTFSKVWVVFQIHRLANSVEHYNHHLLCEMTKYLRNVVSCGRMALPSKLPIGTFVSWCMASFLFIFSLVLCICATNNDKFFELYEHPIVPLPTFVEIQFRDIFDKYYLSASITTFTRYTIMELWLTAFNINVKLTPNTTCELVVMHILEKLTFG